MKYTILFWIIACFILGGCHTQDVDTPFEDRNGIYFTGDHDENGSFIAKDSMSVSFGLRPEEIRFDTVRIKVTYIGRKSTEPRYYKVRVVAQVTEIDNTTDMVEGIHYLPLDTLYTFEPNSFESQFEIIIDREHFNTSFHVAEEHTLVLRLEESKDFYIGIEAARELAIKVNNYMAKPAWWELQGYFSMEKKLGFYHPEKWKALIYVDEGFANPHELPFEKNNGLLLGMKVEAARNLDPWWPKVDEETGDLIYFDQIITNNE